MLNVKVVCVQISFQDMLSIQVHLLDTWYITPTIYAHHVKGTNVLQRHWIPTSRNKMPNDVILDTPTQVILTSD